MNNFNNYLGKYENRIHTTFENSNLKEKFNSITQADFSTLNLDSIELFLPLFNICINGTRLKFLEESLFNAFHKNTSKDFMRLFLLLQLELEEDEANLLVILKNNELNVIDTMDLDRNKNRFHNLQTIDSELEKIKKDFIFPEKNQLYLQHLLSKQVIEWPIFKQDPIISNGVQTGVKRYSKLNLSSLGKSFISFVWSS